jgi:hypothetical protein
LRTSLKSASEAEDQRATQNRHSPTQLVSHGAGNACTYEGAAGKNRNDCSNFIIGGFECAIEGLRGDDLRNDTQIVSVKQRSEGREESNEELMAVRICYTLWLYWIEPLPGTTWEEAPSSKSVGRDEADKKNLNDYICGTDLQALYTSVTHRLSQSLGTWHCTTLYPRVASAPLRGGDNDSSPRYLLRVQASRSMSSIFRPRL